jgi:LysR family cys regulon transcriptional activator
MALNLEQIEAVAAIVRAGFNISAAAAALDRSQPTLSRQVQELERTLGVRVFARTRNKVVGLTPKGEEILRIGQRMLRDAKNLAEVGRADAADDAAAGELKVATTHLHARYLLPRVMKSFAARFPGVMLTLRQGDPVRCCELVAAGEADIGITTIGEKNPADIVTIPAYRVARCVIVQRGHPLTREKQLTLKKLAAFPLVAYSAPYSGRRIVDDTFARAGLKPRIVCSAIDADVSKTYVEIGMGIAILAAIAFDPARDRGLASIDAGHLFAPSVLNLVMRRHAYLGRHVLTFIGRFAPHVGAALIRHAIDGGDIDRARLAREAPLAVPG